MVSKIIEVDGDTAAPVGLPDDDGGEPEAGAEWRRFDVGADGHGERLDRWLAARVPEVSRSYLQQLIADGAVCLDGVPLAKAARRLRVGESVAVELRPTAHARAFVPQPMALNVVYEDAHLLVIDKPAGLVVHPAAGNWSGTLLNGLLAHHEAAARLPRAGIVHRLDKDTSGLMVVAKTPQAYDQLVAMIAQRTVRRIYVALVRGPWRHADAVCIDQPIGRDPRNRLRMAVHTAASGAAKPARTDVRRLDGGAGAQPDWALVGCRLHTGRTHQIRVHLAWLGHALVGDTLYGGCEALGLRRQALHATRLGLQHPLDGRWLAFESALPADMAAATAAAGLHYNPALLWAARPDGGEPVYESE
ncbi:Ribosomal large subunit pseudouridine synthase D [Tepidimonas thermarum]|uniref:Pseudouridine synthase n=1 Tax=Tepidimonas thermarum TaxID=335431 RepID=A0A554X7H9_9BURK|nr:RluA family pseudouridine synthase [Tepidimonas thermarum]TSE31785.1 Ribosomal large subunit pseudouridine synthase D [Tepidimonas thermarum]